MANPTDVCGHPKVAVGVTLNEPPLKLRGFFNAETGKAIRLLAPRTSADSVPSCLP